MNRCIVRMQSLASLLLLAGTVACESGGSPTEPGTVTIEPAQLEVATFEYVRIDVRGAALGSASYTGTLGVAGITARRTSDSTVIFQVPDIAAGEQLLRLQIGRSTAEATLVVRPSPAIEDPAEYVATVDSALTFEVDSIEDWYAAQDPSLDRFLDATAFAADIAMMRATVAGLRADFMALSPAEQREAAMTIMAYRNAEAAAAAGPAIAMDDDEEYFPQCQWPEVATVEEMRTCRRQHRDAAVSTAKSVEQCDTDFDARWQEGDYDGAVGLNYIAYECMKARMLKLKREVAETVRASVRGFFGWGEGPKTTASSRATEWPFYAGIGRAYNPPIGFYNLYANDMEIAPAAAELGEYHQQLSEGWDELNERFPTRFQQAPPWLHSLHELNMMPLEYDRSSLRIGRVEPASVEVSDTVVNNQWLLTFDAAREVNIAPIATSFEVIYDGGEFGSDTATVTTHLITHPLAGEWDVQMDLVVTGYRYIHANRTEFTLPCRGQVPWLGQPVDMYVPTEEFVWRADYSLRCEGGNYPLSSVDLVPFYYPNAPAPYLEDGSTTWEATFALDGENLRASVVWAVEGQEFTATMEGRYTGDRWEGTYTYVYDASALYDPFYESGSGTFSAVPRPPEPPTP